MYRIYIIDMGQVLWLWDWIVHEEMDHPAFTVVEPSAMKFERFRDAQRYRDRLVSLGYFPHIK